MSVLENRRENLKLNDVLVLESRAIMKITAQNIARKNK